MKRAVFMTILIIISASLTGCGEADMEGIVLDVTENKLLLSENLTPKEYEGIKDESVIKIQNEDVEGERESLHLIELTYDQADKFSKGDEVDVWIDGDIFASYPGQAQAKKILIKK